MCAGGVRLEHLEQDIKDSLTFLAQCDWIHNFQITNIFAKQVTKTIPPEWLSCLQKLGTDEINELPFIETSGQEMYPAWPLSLHNFLSKASSLTLGREQVRNISPTPVDTYMARGMTPKKWHEVSWMASLVNNVVCQTSCNLIVDIGSGLGYLDHVLHQVYGHAVLGLETSESHTSAAELRAIRQGLTCTGVKGMKFDITDDVDCLEKFESLVMENLPLTLHCSHSKNVTGVQNSDRASNISSTRVCLIGLHCCGDLSPAVLTLFHRVNCIKAVCCVCCCYHKMMFTDSKFSKFPMSQVGCKHYQDVQTVFPPWHLSLFTFRLGAQETRCRWRSQTSAEHADHIRHVAYRGLLQMIDHEDLETVRKKVRKCDFSSFEAFLTSYFSTCIISEDSMIAILRDLYEKHKDDFDLIEIVTCLQVIVQPVIEALIYKDRLQWLVERGWTDIHVIPIFDEVISPRNLMILAIKPS